MIAWGNANKYALLFVIFYSSQHNIFVATTINQNQPISISVCLFLNTRQLMYILYLPPCSRSLCSVASFHMQVHLARDSVVLTAEWPNRVPRARPSVQGPQRPSPYPAYLLQFIWASMAAICEAVGKQMLFFHLWNQVFGKQSAFWWPESSRWV